MKHESYSHRREGLGRKTLRTVGLASLLAAPFALLPTSAAFAAGDITGTVYNALNGDNVVDAGEPPAADVVVYWDIDGDDVFDDGTDPSDTTDADGKFTIAAADGGPFDLNIVQPPNGTVVGGFAPVTVSGSAVPAGNGFVSYSGSVAGNIGLNGGGFGGPLEDLEVGIDRNGDGIAETTLTDADGDYSFGSVPNGTFAVVLPDLEDSKPAPDLPFTVTAGAAVTDIDYVYQPKSVYGYRMVASDGGVFSYGDAQTLGSLGGTKLNAPIVGMVDTLSGEGYYLVGADGGVFAYGDAKFQGGLGHLTLNAPVVGIALDTDSEGYYLVAADGGVFAFGDAKFVGSAGSIALNAPVVGMAADFDGTGYYLVAADGGVFNYEAVLHGSAGALKLNAPVVGMAIDQSDGEGYWLAAADGGVFNYEAPLHGSAGSLKLNKPVVGIASTFQGDGYQLVASDGGIFSFPDGVVEFYGSAGNIKLNQPVVGMASF